MYSIVEINVSMFQTNKHLVAGEVPRMPGGAPGALQRHSGLSRQRDATEVPGRAYRNHGGGSGPPYR